MSTRYFLFTIFLIFISFSYATYDYTGYEQFARGFNVFDDSSPVLQEVYQSEYVSGHQHPLVADMDSDGTNEIIVSDGNIIRLYQGSNLAVVDAYTIKETGERLSNFLITDRNDDGDKEIMFFIPDRAELHAVAWNGSDFWLDLNVTVTVPQPIATQTAIADCVIGWDDDEENGVYGCQFATSGYGSQYYYVGGFDNTGHENVFNLPSGAALERYCNPVVKHVTVADIDDDSGNEFILGGFFAQSGTEGVFIFIGDMLANGTLILEYDEQIDSGDCGLGSCGFTNFLGDGTNGCLEFANMSKYATAPLVHNFDGAGSTGLEIAMGFSTDTDRCKLIILPSDLDADNADDYPETSDIPCTHFSNAFLSDIYPDTAQDDACVVAYNNLNDWFGVLCGSLQTGFSPQHYYFVLNTTDVMPTYWNQESDHIQQGIAHSSQTVPNLDLLLHDNDEVVTPYGIYELATDYATIWDVILGSASECASSHLCSGQRVWSNNRGFGAIIPTDYDNLNREDLLIQTESLLWYVDDGYTNRGCGSPNNCTISGTICPDPRYTWRQNTTITVEMTVSDYENDGVAAGWDFYYGDPDNQHTQPSTNWTLNNFTSGYTFNTMWYANATTPSATLRLRSRDDQNPTSVDIIDIPFSVSSTTGIDYADGLCWSFTRGQLGDVTNLSGTAEELIEGENDGVTEALDVFTEYSGLSTTTLWLLIIAFVSAAIMFSMTKYQKVSSGEIMGTVAVVLVIDIILLIVGYILGYISGGIMAAIMTAMFLGVGLIVARGINNAMRG